MRAKCRAMKHNPAEAILKRIARRLKAVDLTENAAGVEAGLSRHTIRSMRRNIQDGKQHSVTSRTLEKLAPVLKTSTEWLLNATGPETVEQDPHIPSEAVAAGTGRSGKLTNNEHGYQTFDNAVPKHNRFVSSYDHGSDDEHQAVPALTSGGRVNVPPGFIPQVSARLGLGDSFDADTIQIPFGMNSLAAVAVMDLWKVPDHILRRRLAGGSPQGVHIVECEGDSMEPRIHNGDFVFIDTSRRIPSPPGIFALHDGFSQTLKRLELVPNSEPPRVMIIPENPRHHTYDRLLDEVSIIGRFVGRFTLD